MTDVITGMKHFQTRSALIHLLYSEISIMSLSRCVEHDDRIMIRKFVNS